MAEYKANSRLSKENPTASSVERKKQEKIISGTAKTKKKSEMQKLSSLFISEDVGDVKSYILMDVMIPAIKRGLYDVVTNGLDMIFFNGTGISRRNGYGPTTNYWNRYNTRQPQAATAPSVGSGGRGRAGYDYNDIVVATRGEAEEVLDRMRELIDTYHMVSVADLYDLVGVTGKYTDCSYGWEDLRTAEPVKARDGGYLLKLPQAKPLPR